MRLDPTLSRASRLARAGKYKAALEVLQPEVLRYRGSFNYHYVMGTICLHAGEYGNALTYLRLAREIKSDDPSAILGLAVLFLRRGDTARAVELYLEVLELSQRNSVAKRAMRLIRKRAGTDAFSAWLEAEKFVSLYPAIPFPGFSAKHLLAGAGALLVVVAVGLGIMIQTGLMPNPLLARGSRDIPDGLSLTWEDRRSPISAGGSHRHALSQSQAVSTYDRALALFSAYRDEAARVYLNRIIESNASESLKNRARIMLSLLETPGFDTFRRGDNVSYADARLDPARYRGVHVIWRGIVSNVSITDNGASFEFLLGYDSPRTVDGIVPVVFGHAIPMPDGPVEVLGRIVPIDGESRIMLDGVAIRINL